MSQINFKRFGAGQGELATRHLGDKVLIVIEASSGIGGAAAWLFAALGAVARLTAASRPGRAREELLLNREDHS